MATGERPPFFVASVIFDGGETKLDLKDTAATPITVPAAFMGWSCYIGDTQRVAGAYVKQATCGGRWGFVDTFASCDSKHRNAMSTVRLRQPIDGTKREVDASEKLTITLGCAYAPK